MLCPDALPAVVSSIAISIAQNRSDEEISLLAAAFTQLGDSLALILASRACAAPNEEQESSVV